MSGVCPAYNGSFIPVTPWLVLPDNLGRGLIMISLDEACDGSYYTTNSKAQEGTKNERVNCDIVTVRPKQPKAV